MVTHNSGESRADDFSSLIKNGLLFLRYSKKILIFDRRVDENELENRLKAIQVL